MTISLRIASSCSLLLATWASVWAEGAGQETGGGGGGQDGGSPNPAQGGSEFGALIPMLVVVGVMVLIMWTGVRKQKKEQAAHQQMVSELKTGMQVITAGGVHGTVVRKGEETVDVRTGGDEGAVITFGLNAINKVLPAGEKAEAKA